MPEDVPPPKPKKEFKKRRNFDERPKHGTVEEELSRGEKGLVIDAKEEETKKEQARDWEAKLTYGKQKVVPVTEDGRVVGSKKKESTKK